MGLTFLSKLMSDTSFKVVFVNRGNNYWDRSVDILLEANSQRLFRIISKSRKNSEVYLNALTEAI